MAKYLGCDSSIGCHLGRLTVAAIPIAMHLICLDCFAGMS